MDKLSRERRSWNMSRIPGKHTSPEILVRSLLHRLGYRFRLHCKDLAGRPDVVLPKYHTAIFVQGCFWHRHHACKYAYTPKTNYTFWQNKFRQNVTRDKRNRKLLTSDGWKVLYVWECEMRNQEKLSRRLSRALPRGSICSQT